MLKRETSLQINVHGLHTHLHTMSYSLGLSPGDLRLQSVAISFSGWAKTENRLSSSEHHGPNCTAKEVDTHLTWSSGTGMAEPDLVRSCRFFHPVRASSVCIIARHLRSFVQVVMPQTCFLTHCCSMILGPQFHCSREAKREANDNGSQWW